MNKSILVTGSTGGIGSAIVNKFKQEGYNIFAPTRNELDLSSDTSIKQYMSSHIKKIDVFVHCAGINNPQNFDALSLENITNTMDINTLSAIKLLKIILPIMKKNKYGKIVLISSLWSQYAKAGRISYAMSKSALDALARGIAKEYGEYNILINSILPGFIDTELTRKNLSKNTILEIKNHTPLRKLGNSMDIAEITYFLTNSNNSFITGQSIKVDGGYTL